MKSGERFNDKQKRKPEKPFVVQRNIILTINLRKREQKFQNHLCDDICKKIIVVLQKVFF